METKKLAKGITTEDIEDTAEELSEEEMEVLDGLTSNILRITEPLFMMSALLTIFDTWCEVYNAPADEMAEIIKEMIDCRDEIAEVSGLIIPDDFELIRAVVKEPGEEAFGILIQNTLENLQGIVGGKIEHVSISESAGMIINQEGKFLGLEKELPVLRRHHRRHSRIRRLRRRGLHRLPVLTERDRGEDQRGGKMRDPLVILFYITGFVTGTLMIILLTR